MNPAPEPPDPAPAGEGGDEGSRAGKPSARLWRIVAGSVAGIVVLGALLLTALRIALVYLPEHADKLRAWVERQTHMRIEYESLDARMRWYGPELVLRRVRMLEEDGTQALFTASEGSVGLDLWNFFRTGQFVAGRVHIADPSVTIVRLADGRIRLLGLGERPSDRPPFDFDRLPAGRLVIEGATVVYRDLMTGRPPLELRDLQAELRRDRDFVVMDGKAVLPESLGSTATFSARLKGSLDEREKLDARVELKSDLVRLAGLDDLLPAQVTRPKSGRGAVRAVLVVQQGRFVNARLEFALRNVVLRLPVRAVPPIESVQVREPRLELAEGGFLRYPTVTKEMVGRPAPVPPAEVRLGMLEGDARLRREGGLWKFRVEEFRTQAGDRRPRAATRIAGSWQGHPVSRFGLELEVDDADLASLWPLVLAFAPSSFDRWAGLAPQGKIKALRLSAARARAGLAPTFRVDADVAALGFQPHDRMPGIAGFTAKLSGTEQRGTLQLRAVDPGFDWPRVFREPIELTSATADLGWRREGESWVLGGKNARLEHSQANASVDFELSFARGGASPVLELSATVGRIDDISIVAKFVPVGRLRERAIAWLDRAFVRGSASNGQLSYRGPVRKFPFRHGEGDFRATVDVRGATLDYYPGFAPLADASGTVEFHNASIKAQVASGQVGGMGLGPVSFAMGDYKWSVLEIDADARGDLQKALAYVQASPLGPRLGSQFMGLAGRGPARYKVQLTLPVMSEELRREYTQPIPERDYRVRANLDSVTVALPALRAPAQRVTGTFELHNDDITAREIRGVILDGPFELTATPGKKSRDVLAAVDLTARGRAGGVKLPAFIGLPSTIGMAGSTAWELRGRIEKRREGGQWPLQFDVTTNLAGLAIEAPRPFRKQPDEARATRVRLEIPGQRYNDVSVESGSARARLRFADRNGQWRLDRGTARFDSQPVALPAQPGLFVTGDWPQFDLGEWVALGDVGTAAAAPAAAQGQRLMDWLGPVDVHLDRATVYGFEFRDVVAKLRGEGNEWRVGVSGPHAEGQVTVPDDLSRGRPIVLALKRLQLLSAPVDAGTPPGSSTLETDPRRLPAMQADVDDFTWQARRFGRLQANITRDARGLTFQSLQTSSPAFTINARGSWFMEQGGPRTRIEAEFESTDFGAAAQALGYRDAIDAARARVSANLWWQGAPSADAIRKMNGTLRVALNEGKLRDIEPGAGRVLGLLSVAQLPRRLSLDFRDVTDQGLAFNSVRGDFDMQAGNAYTQNLLLKGPAVNMGIVGRTGLAAEDYDQTIVVSGNTSGPLAVAGALAAGPVVGAGVLVLSQLFKDQLQGLARVYYRVTGPWAAPVVERISAPVNESAPAAAAGTDKGGTS